MPRRISAKFLYVEFIWLPFWLLTAFYVGNFALFDFYGVVIDLKEPFGFFADKSAYVGFVSQCDRSKFAEKAFLAIRFVL